MQTDQIDYCQKWKQVQNIANMYWNRWLEEYIPTLSPHSKWARQPRDFKISDLVTIKLKYIHIPPNHWPLGVVIEAFVGSNDIILSVKVKTPSTELIRPSNSLCLLEASNTYKWNWTSSYGGRMFRHILLIKDNSIFVNHLQWYWIRHYVFDWFMCLIIIKVFCFFSLSWDFCCSGFICSTRLFFSAVTRRQERERWCQNNVKN